MTSTAEASSAYAVRSRRPDTIRGHAARAVTVIDRSLGEHEPGVYSARVRLPAPGRYEASLLVDAPQLVHCFSFEVKPNPVLKGELGPLEIEYLAAPAKLSVGQRVELRFRLADSATHAPFAHPFDQPRAL